MHSVSSEYKYSKTKRRRITKLNYYAFLSRKDGFNWTPFFPHKTGSNVLTTESGLQKRKDDRCREDLLESISQKAKSDKKSPDRIIPHIEEWRVSQQIAQLANSEGYLF